MRNIFKGKGRLKNIMDCIVGKNSAISSNPICNMGLVKSSNQKSPKVEDLYKHYHFEMISSGFNVPVLLIKDE